MGFKKYQSVEKTEVLDPARQAKISSNLHAIGKTSAKDLSEKERKRVLDAHRV